MPDSTVTSLIPRALTQEIKRPHLLQQLKEARDLKLIALLAPSGFGKTTLLAQFARLSKHRVIWIPLGLEDGDFLAFLKKLITSLQEQRVLPPLSFQFSSLHQTSQDHLQVLILQHLADTRDHVKIILDKVEHLAADTIQWLVRLLSQLPEGHQMLISGYENSILPLQTWKSDPEVMVLGAEELAFNEEEARKVLQKNKLEWEPQWFEQTRGWPVAVSLRRAGQPLGFDAVDWIEQALLELPEQLRQDLPLLIGEPIWEDPLILPDGRSLPQNWLVLLLSHGLPLTHLENQLFAPHTLLLEALDRLLARNPRNHREMHLQWARKHEAASNFRTALDHYLKVNSIPYALQVVEHMLTALRLRADLGALRTILEKFQLHDLPPHLQGYLAVACMDTRNHEKGREIVEALQEAGHEDAMTCLAQAALALKQRNLNNILKWAERGLELAQENTDRMRLRRMKIISLNYQQRNEEALAECHIFLQEANELGSLWHIARALTALANVASDSSDLQTAENTYLKALELAREHRLDTVKAEVCHNYALQLATCNRPLEGLRLLNEALEISPGVLLLWEASLVAMRGTILEQLGQYKKAMADYQKAIELGSRFGMHDSVFRHSLCLVNSACLAGELDVARQTLSLARQEVNPEIHLHEVYLNASEALLALQTGDFEKARRHFEQAHHPHLTPWEQSQLHFYLAEVSRRENRLTFQEIQTAFEKLDPAGDDGPLHEVHTRFPELFFHCLEQGWYPERIQRILEDLSQREEYTEESHPLNIQSLGGFRAQTHDQNVTISLKKCQELLVLLALKGPQTRDGLIDRLWDGQNTSRIQDHFKVLVRRLRTMLTQAISTPFDPLPFQNGMYALHERLQVSCDVRAFLDPQSLLTPATCLELYQGPFLPTHSSEWVLEVRTQCQQRLLTLLCALPSDDPDRNPLLRKVFPMHAEEPTWRQAFGKDTSDLRSV